MQNSMLLNKLENALHGSKINKMEVFYDTGLLFVVAETEYEHIEAYIHPARYTIQGFTTLPKYGIS